MFYCFLLTVPAETTEANPAELVMRLTAGTVYRVSVGFPLGCVGLVHVAIDRFKHQVWPSNPGASFAWDDYNVDFAEEYELREAPCTLVLRAWNEDDSFAHTVTCRIGVRAPLRAVLGKVARKLWG